MSQNISSVNKSFFLMAAIAALLTAGTNLYIHLTDFSAQTFEERILLFQDKSYIANRVIIITHCILVIISTWGMGLLLSRQAKGFSQLGILSFTVFGLTEISRMVFSLNYVNGLREKYFGETNLQIRQFLEYSLNNAGLVNNIFFRIFITAFAFGLLFYSIALLNRNIKSDIIFGITFLVLSGITFLALVNEFAENNTISKLVYWSSITLQPLLRVWMGVWIFKNFNKQTQ